MSVFEVIRPGVASTVQDLFGRRGLWGVGVPPSGAWDDVSFALANRAVGNEPGAAGLEAVLRGPVLTCVAGSAPALVCVTGAASAPTLDGVPIPLGTPVRVDPGQVLDVGPARGPGIRIYLAVRGGLDVPAVLGSRSTFLLGGFGGLSGRALVAGDRLHTGPVTGCRPPAALAEALPELLGDWTVRVIVGPHGAPEYLTPAGADALFTGHWRLDHRSDRTGVRLVGPAIEWARPDGGDAGLHPSNIHDSPYPVGGIMVSGNTPVVVGPDGPSLGGFVLPAVVLSEDRWKLAQCRPGDRVRLQPVLPARPTVTASTGRRPSPLLEVPASGDRPALRVRYAGDRQVLVEVGPPQLDLAVRLRIHLLAEALEALPAPERPSERVEGVRSLLLASPEPPAVVARRVGEAWRSLPPLASVELPVREVTLPIAFDDPSVHDAMTRYQSRVRPDAPWCPDNVEFIRRVNGLDRRDEVFELVRAATYLVIGLGDVYLGAPVAVPLDPRHRLVTTKYDPPRTWTPANAVGIGGVYLCVYGMEGPGGYQLVGRTVPVWRNPGPEPAGRPANGNGRANAVSGANANSRTNGNEAGPPWLLRQFDLLRFTPVSGEELTRLRAAVAGGAPLSTRPARLRLTDLVGHPEERAEPAVLAFTARRQAAFDAERGRWALAEAKAGQ